MTSGDFSAVTPNTDLVLKLHFLCIAAVCGSRMDVARQWLINTRAQCLGLRKKAGKQAQAGKVGAEGGCPILEATSRGTGTEAPVRTLVSHDFLGISGTGEASEMTSENMFGARKSLFLYIFND